MTAPPQRRPYSAPAAPLSIGGAASVQAAYLRQLSNRAARGEPIERLASVLATTAVLLEAVAEREGMRP